MKKVLIILAGLIVVIFLALIFVPRFINWNRYKPKIATMVKDAMGRDLRIDGDIQLAIFPTLSFSIEGVHLSNAPGMQAPEMVSIGSVSGRLQLLPLLRRRVVVDTFIVEHPALNLEVDKDGRANWEFATAGTAPAPRQETPPKGTTGLPLRDLSLGEVRFSQGHLSMVNAMTGQTVIAKDMHLSVALASLASPFSLDVRMVLNDEPVTVKLSVDTPDAVLEGAVATLQAAVTTKYITTQYQGRMQQQPVPGLDGTFTLDIPSVGQLASWLDRPLDPAQPDPGPLSIRAVFEGDNKTVALTEATIAGKDLQARATGRYDGSGDIAKIALNVESDTLNVDRYLPPPTAKAKQPAAARPRAEASRDIMALFSTAPLDLKALRQTEADIRIGIKGIKAMGYDVGRIDFTTTLHNSLLTATLAQLQLYGGTIKGALKLDATSDTLGVEATAKIDRVKVDRLAKAAAGSATPVTGVASGNLRATARGASPRGLVETLQGAMTFDLGGVDVKNAPAGAIAALKVQLDLPGIENPPSLQGSVVYNKQQVKLHVSTDPLRQVLSGEAFVLKAKVDSNLVRLGYDGKVQQRPVPGLDGAFHLNIPSVGKLAAWLGQPLSPAQPDPGPLEVRAVFAGDGAKMALKQASIEGQALKATASGSFDGSGEVAKIALQVQSDVLDIDRYLPHTAGKQPPLTTSAPAAAAPANPLATLSDTPFVLDGLNKTAADISITLGGIRALGYKVGKVALTSTLANGLLATELREFNLYGGQVRGMLKLDGSRQTLGVDTNIRMEGVAVDELANTATDGKLAVHGTASGSLQVRAQGNSPKALVESLSGKVAFKLGGGERKQAKAGAISGLNVDLDLPGLTKPTRVKGDVTYNQEQVQMDLHLDSLHKALAGERFALKSAITSKLLQASYDGTLQQRPGPGLDGALKVDVPSVGQLLAWLEQPLPQTQPDPGPLNLRAMFAAGTSQATLKEATISGKALQVKATGSVDHSAAIPVLRAKVQVTKADLNAYLPPAAQDGSAAPEATTTAKKEPTGWSEEPLDLSALSAANGDIEVQIDALRYREITIQPGHIRVKLHNAVLDASADPLQVSGGKITTVAHIDASGKAARMNYDVAISGLEARPLLKTLANNDRLSGKTTFQLQGSATGRNQKELVRSLQGKGRFTFLDGAIHGMNIAAALRKAKTLGFSKEAGEAVKTDFAELSGSFVIQDGVVKNQDLKMLAPLVRLSGSGLVPMPQQTVDYDLTAKLVPSLKGQGGSDALAGVPIPIKVKGPWHNIAYKVDWHKVFANIAADPERLKNLPQDLQEAGKNFGIKLPLPKLPVPEKGTNPLEQLQKLQKQLLPGSTSTTQPEKEKKPEVVDPLKTLQELLKR